ncbi:MAG TPA: monovalent cation/H(+) antiporter subunit G [Terricaulis sp.]|nr:monovalent cation/H(+) antiporter subunit G [Terricaulis sp.]
MGALNIFAAIAGGALIAAGLACMIGGAIGVLRFPDFYTRLHGARAADGVGAALFLAGLAIVSGDGAVALRLALLAVLVIALAPLMAHLSANAAHVGGLAPLAGPYKAPRPGVRRDES